MTKKIKLENLKPGQEVAMANCVETANVIRRVGQNLYEVEWKGQIITMPRNNLGVWRFSRWFFGAANAAE